jgi:hypothetical protein
MNYEKFFGAGRLMQAIISAGKKPIFFYSRYKTSAALYSKCTAIAS